MAQQTRNAVTVHQAKPESDGAPVSVSVVCPFYNESAILESAITTLLSKLADLQANWELIVVNDGSKDDSRQIAESLLAQDSRMKLVSYPYNRGRGFALRQGIAASRGDVIVTTEIDLSWGEDVVERLYAAMQEDPDTDIVVASPHLPGGGYKNVPAKRVLFSKWGNLVIRACISNACTMNTGMTRAYRREAIQALPLEEDRKEFHIEVILKAVAMHMRIREIPCILEWKEYKHQGQRVERKSSSKIKRLVMSHSLFSLFANPVRYVWAISGLTMITALGFLGWAVIRLASGLDSVFVAIISLALTIIAVLFFTFGVIAQQGNMIQRELWSVKRDLLALRRDRGDDANPGGDGD